MVLCLAAASLPWKCLHGLPSLTFLFALATLILLALQYCLYFVYLGLAAQLGAWLGKKAWNLLQSFMFPLCSALLAPLNHALCTCVHPSHVSSPSRRNASRGNVKAMPMSLPPHKLSSPQA